MRSRGYTRIHQITITRKELSIITQRRLSVSLKLTSRPPVRSTAIRKGQIAVKDPCTKRCQSIMNHHKRKRHFNRKLKLHFSFHTKPRRPSQPEIHVKCGPTRWASWSQITITSRITSGILKAYISTETSIQASVHQTIPLSTIVQQSKLHQARGDGSSSKPREAGSWIHSKEKPVGHPQPLPRVRGREWNPRST